MGTDPSADPVAIVERMQEELAILRGHVSHEGPLSIGDRAQAVSDLNLMAATLGNLKRRFRRASEGSHV